MPPDNNNINQNTNIFRVALKAVEGFVKTRIFSIDGKRAADVNSSNQLETSPTFEGTIEAAILGVSTEDKQDTQITAANTANTRLGTIAGDTTSIDGKITACDTTNKATDTLQTTGNNILATIAADTDALVTGQTAANASLVDIETNTNKAVTQAEYNIELTNADEEYEQALPTNCKGYELKNRNNDVITRFSLTSGKVATPTAPYITTEAGTPYSSPPNISLTGKTIYFASPNAGDVIELIVWS